VANPGAFHSHQAASLHRWAAANPVTFHFRLAVANPGDWPHSVDLVDDSAD